MPVPPILVGVTGPTAAGKQTVIDWFVKTHNFKTISLSDMLRESLTADGMELSRDNLIARGNKLREQNGPQVLATLALNKLKEDPFSNYIIDSIRHKKEAETLAVRPCFFLLSVDAPVMRRFQNVVSRSRSGDPMKLEEFLDRDDKEQFGLAGASSQSIRTTMGLADVRIVNNGTIEDLHEKLESLDVMSRDRLRPTWDTYFMQLAILAAKRTNCIRRRVGAVITQDNRVIATGYNGTPRGTSNCNEGGCARCCSTSARGQGLDECLCLHAEENAIIEAGRARTQGGTIYTNLCPCLSCSKKIVQAGIVEVVYAVGYTVDEASAALMKQAGIVMRQHVPPSHGD